MNRARKECEPSEHCWHRPTEGVTMCRICGLDANELVLGLRADEEWRRYVLEPISDPRREALERVAEAAMELERSVALAKKDVATASDHLAAAVRRCDRARSALAAALRDLEALNDH